VIGLCTNTLGEREYEGLGPYALGVGGLRSVSGENHKQKDSAGFVLCAATKRTPQTESRLLMEPA
jgi:hypothetical protein